jgi:4-hydroxy-4-methyl-2-oxoglutarate aldolase
MPDGADSDIGPRLRTLGAASVFDACSEARLAGPEIRAVWGPVVVAGQAFTVATEPDDNLALHRAVAEAPHGSVIVVAAGGSVRTAIFGDLLSEIAVGRGIAGLVTDGAVRDTDRIRSLGFPVFARGVNLAAPAKRAWGTTGVDVLLGAARIAPGDWIVGDGDGLVAIPEAHVAAAVGRAEEIRRREAELVARAIEGESTVDQLGLRPPA